jgi:hypothetical protein
VTITDVSVSGAATGVIVTSVGSGVVLAGVHVEDADTGLWLRGGTGLDVSGSSMSDVGTGIDVSGPGTTDSAIHGNDLSGATIGCHDSTTGSGTAGTANTWTDDVGSAATPAGICSP